MHPTRVTVVIFNAPDASVVLKNFQSNVGNAMTLLAASQRLKSASVSCAGAGTERYLFNRVRKSDERREASSTGVSTLTSKILRLLFVSDKVMYAFAHTRIS
jgi:hypothetical protein